MTTANATPTNTPNAKQLASYLRETLSPEEFATVATGLDKLVKGIQAVLATEPADSTR